MLLLLHVLGARIYAGARVADAGDEVRFEDGREARVSYWNYRTLEGHVEAGQRDFEVWKWIESGAVEFRTHAVSRPAESTALVRLGVVVLGRHKQVEFGRRACLRMAMLTERALRRPEATPPPRTFDSRLLSIHLRDHHALLVATRELAQRMSSGGRLPELQALASELRAAAADDLVAVEKLLARLDSAPSLSRAAAVRVGERLGRLKLNGRIVRASPLSAVVELEGAALLLASVRMLWEGLAKLDLGPEDAGERAARAERLRAAAEELRLGALPRAVGLEEPGGA